MPKEKKGYKLVKLESPNTPEIKTLKKEKLIDFSSTNTGEEALESPQEFDDTTLISQTKTKTSKSSNAFETTTSDSSEDVFAKYNVATPTIEEQNLELLSINNKIVDIFKKSWLANFPFFDLYKNSTSKLILAEKRIILPVSIYTYDKGYRHQSCSGAIEETHNEKGAKIQWYMLNYGDRDPLSFKNPKMFNPDSNFISDDQGTCYNGDCPSNDSLKIGSICLKKLFFDSYVPKWVRFFLPKKIFQVYEYSTNFLPYAHTDYYSDYYKNKLKFSIDTIAVNKNSGGIENIFEIPNKYKEKLDVETIDIVSSTLKKNNDEDISVPGENLIDDADEMSKLSQLFSERQYSEYLEWRTKKENLNKKWYHFCDENNYPYCCIYKLYTCNINTFKGKMISDLLMNSTTAMVQRYLLDLCKNRKKYQDLTPKDIVNLEKKSQKFLEPKDKNTKSSK